MHDIRELLDAPPPLNASREVFLPSPAESRAACLEIQASYPRAFLREILKWCPHRDELTPTVSEYYQPLAVNVTPEPARRVRKPAARSSVVAASSREAWAPTPDEIAEACLAIQAGWSPEEERSRRAVRQGIGWSVPEMMRSSQQNPDGGNF